MQFVISKNENNTWGITPASGAFEGIKIAEAEGINLQAVKFAGRTLIGGIKALWGATVLDEDVYSDMETLRGLHLGGRFDVKLEEKLTLDYDGFTDMANHLCRGAKKVLLIGGHIYARGAQ